MKTSIISFTNQGGVLRDKLSEIMGKQGFTIISSVDGRDENITLKEWTKKEFNTSEVLIFIGACAIAVRSIAAYLNNKTSDPAVIVIDEKANFIIPILSGHIGGANEIAFKISNFIGGTPVITTATDINKKFAVDVFASKNNLIIENMKCAKEISAAILNDEKIGFKCQLEILNELPRDLVLNLEPEYGINISINEEYPFDKTLLVVPQIVTLGIGCKKNTSAQTIEDAVIEFLKENGISLKSIKNIASIDLKKEEKGLLEFIEKFNFSSKFYSSLELENVHGTFSNSEFVNSITGVSCVCERAAVKGSENGELIINKTIKKGITIAVALGKRSVKFE